MCIADYIKVVDLRLIAVKSIYWMFIREFMSNRYAKSAMGVAIAALSAAVISTCAAYNSRSELYRARNEVERLKKDNADLKRAQLFTQKPVHSMNLACVIADINGDGLPDALFVAPDGKYVFIDDVASKFHADSLYVPHEARRNYESF